MQTPPPSWARDQQTGQWVQIPWTRDPTTGQWVQVPPPGWTRDAQSGQWVQMPPPGWMRDPQTGQWIQAPPGWTRDPQTGQWVQMPPPPPVVPVQPRANVPPAPPRHPTRPFFADLELPLFDLPLLYLVQKNRFDYSYGLGFRGAVGGMFPHSGYGLGIGGSIHVGFRDARNMRDYHVDLILRRNESSYIANFGIGFGMKTLKGSDGYTYGVPGFHLEFDLLAMIAQSFGIDFGMDFGVYANNGVSTMILGFHVGPGIAIDRWALPRSRAQR